MPDMLVFALPSTASIPFIAVLLAITAGLTSIATWKAARRSRRSGPAAVKSAADDHAPEDHDLLWRALEAHVMVNVADGDGRTVSVNDSFIETTGYTRDEIIGRSLRDFLFVPGATDRDMVLQAIHGEGRWTGETHLARKDGSELWTRTTIVGYCNEAGELTRTVAVRTDITGNKILQDAGQKKLFLERLSDEVYVFDANDLSLCYLNESALSFLGWNERDYVGKSLAETNKNFDEAGFRTRVLPLRTGVADVLTYESIHEDRFVEISLQLDRAYDGNERFIGVVRDITTRKLAESAKTALVATVSHELRTPLTSALGALKLVQSGVLGDLPAKPRDILNIAVRNIERLTVTINDLLDLEKVEAGKMEMRLAPTDLSSVLQEAIASNSSYASELGVELQCVGVDAPRIVDADRDRMIQVLNNLLSNAAKFSRRGQTVEAELRDTETTFQIIVRDHGIGIPDEFQNKLFERFVQVGSAVDGRPTGSGLGLNITKVIVERHGGSIGFSSKLGQGSTFCVELPRREQLDDALRTAAQ